MLNSKTMISKLLTLSIITIFTGCTNLDGIRRDANNESLQKEIATTRENRILKITDNETYYSPKLVCAGKKIKSLYGDTQVKISVAPILDKTGKVYPGNTTAISELVLHSLSKVGSSFSIVETPLGYDFSEMRNSYSKEFLELNANALTPNNRLPVGVLLESDLYVAGSLVQYDDSSETPASTLSATINKIQARRNITSVSIGLQLRLVNAHTGKVIFHPNMGVASVFLKNQLFKSSGSANIFHTSNSTPYGLDYSVDVADPVQYAVNEIIEKALYELVSKFTIGTLIEC